MSNGLETLAELKHAEILKQFPGVPSYAVPCTKYSDKTANDLTKCIIDYIRVTGGHAERVANMGRQIGTSKRRKWIPSSGTRGTADIHSMKAGRFIAIEVKIGSDRQSEAQKKYQQTIEQGGGLYIIARSFDQFLEQWQAIDICQ